MYFKPIDEISLRHLFSSLLGEKTLKMSYLGPVLNAQGNIESSPDCRILDSRGDKDVIKRCEFKYSPKSKEDFKDNGIFEIAIVWSIKSQALKEQLEGEFYKQNGCGEIKVLGWEKAFRDLEEYRDFNVEEIGGMKIEELRKIIQGKWGVREDASFPFAACIAARVYPEKFRVDRVANELKNRFRDMRTGRRASTVVTGLFQTSPKLVERIRYGVFRWDNEVINATVAANEIEVLLKNWFGASPPSTDIIEALKREAP